jgi:hypothetical protein
MKKEYCCHWFIRKSPIIRPKLVKITMKIKHSIDPRRPDKAMFANFELLSTEVPTASNLALLGDDYVQAW